MYKILYLPTGEFVSYYSEGRPVRINSKKYYRHRPPYFELDWAKGSDFYSLIPDHIAECLMRGKRMSKLLCTGVSRSLYDLNLWEPCPVINLSEFHFIKTDLRLPHPDLKRRREAF